MDFLHFFFANVENRRENDRPRSLSPGKAIAMDICLDCWQSVFLSKSSRDYGETRFTRQRMGPPLIARWRNTPLSDPHRQKRLPAVHHLPFHLFILLFSARIDAWRGVWICVRSKDARKQ